MPDNEEDTQNMNATTPEETPVEPEQQPRHAAEGTGTDPGQAQADAQPETLDELKERFPEFADLPDLTPAQELDPVTAAKVMTCHAQILEGMVSMTKRTEDGDPSKLDQLDWAVYSEYIIETADPVLTTIAVDEQAWKKWCKGRNPYRLVDLFFMLVNLYAGQLGKSDGSAISTDAAPSN